MAAAAEATPLPQPGKSTEQKAWEVSQSNRLALVPCVSPLRWSAAVRMSRLSSARLGTGPGILRILHGPNGPGRRRTKKTSGQSGHTPERAACCAGGRPGLWRGWRLQGMGDPSGQGDCLCAFLGGARGKAEWLAKLGVNHDMKASTSRHIYSSQPKNIQTHAAHDTLRYTHVYAWVGHESFSASHGS